MIDNDDDDDDDNDDDISDQSVMKCYLYRSKPFLMLEQAQHY